ncbi:hypothetical protein GCM10023223_27570 [Stackebrandtia albiflava]
MQLPRPAGRSRTLFDALLIVGLTWGVFAVLFIGGLGALASAVWLLWWGTGDRDLPDTTQTGLLILGVPIALTVGGNLLLGLLRALRTMRADRPSGYSLSPEAAPGLWAVIREVAAELTAPVPAEIRMITWPDCHLESPPRSFMPRNREYRLYLGMPVLTMASQVELRALLAVALAPAAGSHGRLRREALRLIDTPVSLGVPGRRGPAAMIVRQCRRVRDIVTRPARRRLTSMGDHTAAAVAGASPVRYGIWSLALWMAAWEDFLEYRLLSGPAEVVAPRHAYAAFADFVARRIDDYGRRVVTDDVSTRWPDRGELGRRLAALPGGRPPTHDTVPAASGLVTDVDALTSLMESRLYSLGRTEYLDWSDYVEAVTVGSHRRGAEEARRLSAQAIGDEFAQLSHVLDEVAAGRGGELFRALAIGGVPTVGLAHMIWTAAYDSGVLHIAEGDDGIEVRDRDGELFDAERIAVMLTPDPESAGRVARQLTESGVDLTPRPGDRVPNHRVPVPYTGIGAVEVNGTLGDLVVTTAGLLFVPGLPAESDAAPERLAAILSRWPLRTLMARPGCWLPFHDVSDASVAPPSLWWELTTDADHAAIEPPWRIDIVTVEGRRHLIRWTERTESLPSAVFHLAAELRTDPA